MAETFAARDYEFKIQEFDLVSQAWCPYSVERDGYTARNTCDRLNADYAPYGRKFRVMRRALGPWDAVHPIPVAGSGQ